MSQRQEGLYHFEVRVVYRASSRTVTATQTLSQKTKQKQTKKASVVGTRVHRCGQGCHPMIFDLQGREVDKRGEAEVRKEWGTFGLQHWGGGGGRAV